MSEYNYLNDINGFNNWDDIIPVTKGWSSDKKFLIKNKDGRKLLLRLSDYKDYDKKKTEYNNMKDLSKLNINMSIPVDFGVCGEGKYVYLLLTWVNGEDAIDILPKLDEKKQYELGVKAGNILKKIHSIKAPVNVESWENKYKNKIERVIDNYLKCGYKIENEKNIIEYIKANKILLKNRLNTFQHGDYHVGNLLVTKENDIGVIDFNRSSYGDPWEEYDRFNFTWDLSKAFALGQIHSYFNNQVPDKFFKLMSLYNATNLLASIPWSLKFGESDLKNMLSHAKKTTDSYDGFKTHIPAWYISPNKWRENSSI